MPDAVINGIDINKKIAYQCKEKSGQSKKECSPVSGISTSSNNNHDINQILIFIIQTKIERKIKLSYMAYDSAFFRSL